MFEGLTPTRYLWVSASAAPGGNGSADSPFQTIQAAVNVAGAGDAVMVRAGEYRENVKIKQVGGGGQPDKPLWILSVDGPQAAHIVAPNAAVAAFTGSGAENVVLSGFHITGGKNGIQFSQNGSDFTDMPKNIVISGNLVDGAAEDGIKIDHAANVSIIDNVVKARAGEGIDFVAVIDSVVKGNEVSGAQGAGGIIIKGGSTSVAVESNWVHDVRADGITVGGWTGAKFFVPGRDTYEARNVEVSHNIVENVGKRPVNVMGGVDSTIHDNFLEATPGYYAVIGVSSGDPSAAVAMHSSGISIFNNTFTRATQLVSATAGDSTGLVVSGNKAAVWSENAGSSLTAGSGDSVILPTSWQAPVSVGTPLADAGATPPAGGPALPTAPLKALFVLQESGAYTSKFVGTNAARDNLVGTKGNDLLDGKNNQDKMTGGAGDDTYVIDVSADQVIEAAKGGVDTVLTAKSGAYVLAANVENLTLNGKVAQYGVGNGLDNIIKSNDYGSHIEGGAGDDILVAGRGGDALKGDGGADIFQIGVVPAKAAHILDFDISQDMIDLRGLSRAVGYAGSDPIADQYLTLTADGAGGTAIYFDADGAGAQAAVMVAILDDVAPLSLHAHSDWFF